MNRYALLTGPDGNGVYTVGPDVIESETDPDGNGAEWVACPAHVGPGFTVDATFTVWTAPVVVAEPQRCTKRAFQKRFPKMPNNISTKWDAMCMFLRDDSYAAHIGYTGQPLFDLRMMITTGTELMLASPFVSMGPDEDAANMTLLLTNPAIPVEFRLSTAERDVMLNTPLENFERYTG